MVEVLLRLVLVVGLVLGLGWGYLFGPHYLVKYKMEEIVASAAMTWANSDLERGKYELEHRFETDEIPEYLPTDKCDFYEETDIKWVDCKWYVDVYIPVVGQVRRVRFQEIQGASRDGRLQLD